MICSDVMGEQRLPSVQDSLLTDKFNIDHIQSINTGDPELAPTVDP